MGETLISRGHKVMLLISRKEIDALATQERHEFQIETIPGVGLPRIFSPAIFGFLNQLRGAFAQCRSLYGSFLPDAVLGMGGFTSTAPILAARFHGVATFLHESNAIPGKANRLNARLVNRVLLGFDECCLFFPKKRCEVTGTPVRTSLTQRIPKNDALGLFGLAAGMKTLLVMGGSQGAHGINAAILNCLPALRELSMQVIHLTGAQDEAKAREAYAQAGIPAFVAAFHHRMEEAYSAADVAVARSGAASVTELSYFGIPSILIPYPFAAEDHQTLNARIAERAGAAIVLAESDAGRESLASILRRTLSDPGQLSAMSAAAKRMGVRDAAEKVADALLQYCQRHLP